MWRGSVYKHVWKDGLLFVSLYFALSLIYRFALNSTQKITFEKLVLYCKKESTNIPVAFVLGFYVTIVVNRWWTQVNDAMPWPDDLAIGITSLVHGNDDRGRLMRRTLVRYLNLSWILTLCSISSIAKKRFPTLDHLVEIGMMTKNEQEIFDSIKTNSNKYFVPLVWATILISTARKEERIMSDYNKVYLVELISGFRGKLGTLFNYDWLSVPLVYTQVVTIAVQAYFLANVVGAQFLENNDAYPDRDIDIYIPVFTLLQFLFYMGWLKVAESLINPFGEDDDDYDTNWVIDRNIQACYLIVDDMHSEYPELIKDAFWDSMDVNLPYTAAAEQSKMDPYLGSTNEMELNDEEAMFLPMATLVEEPGVSKSGADKASAETATTKEPQVAKDSLQWLIQRIRRATNSRTTENLKPYDGLQNGDKGISGSSQPSSNSLAYNQPTLKAGVKRFPIQHMHERLQPKYPVHIADINPAASAEMGNREANRGPAINMKDDQVTLGHTEVTNESISQPPSVIGRVPAVTVTDATKKPDSQKPHNLNRSNNHSPGDMLQRGKVVSSERLQQQQTFQELQSWQKRYDIKCRDSKTRFPEITPEPNLQMKQAERKRIEKTELSCQKSDSQPPATLSCSKYESDQKQSSQHKDHGKSSKKTGSPTNSTLTEGRWRASTSMFNRKVQKESFTKQGNVSQGKGVTKAFSFAYGMKNARNNQSFRRLVEGKRPDIIERFEEEIKECEEILEDIRRRENVQM